MSLSNDLKRIAARRKEDLDKIVQASLLEAGSSVVVKSPALDGFLRNSWMSAWGAIDGSTRDADKSGSQSIGSLNQKLTDIRFDADFFFTNSQPYASKIEYDGHSQQAPDGMLRVSLLDWDKIVARNVQRYK